MREGTRAKPGNQLVIIYFSAVVDGVSEWCIK